MVPMQTERLTLREVTEDDAAFIRALVNEPDWLANIGDRGVRNEDDARAYIRDKMMAAYRADGFGMYVVALQDSAEPVGLCGLVNRETLDDVDIGFALRKAHWGRGYALEAARAVLQLARAPLGLPRVVAIALADNAPSRRLLEKLDMQLVREYSDEKGDHMALYAIQLDA